MRYYRLFNPILALICIVILALSCKREWDNPNDKLVSKNNVKVPTVSTLAITNKTVTSAEVSGTVTSDGGGAVTDRGVYWGTSPNPVTTGTKRSIGNGMGIFSATLTGLTPGTPYYVKAYATNSAGTGYGNELGFTTSVSIPTVTTTAITNTTATTVEVGGNVTSAGGGTVTDRGIYWGTSTNPVSTGTKRAIGSNLGIFSTTLTDLIPGTLYYVRAYATNNTGTGYGDELGFTTGVTKPAVTTTAITNKTANTAEVGGNVTSGGGGTVTDRGVYWGTTSNPVTTGIKRAIGSDLGIFSATLTDLTPGTPYYVRAYSINSAGTGYGDELGFTTDMTKPSITTTSITNKTTTTAEIGGNVTSDGGGTVTDRGVYWGISPDPVFTGTKRTIGSGWGVFSATLTDLTPGTPYYVRAYATNSAGTGYGDELGFTTGVTKPSVTTAAISNKTATTAEVGGNVTSGGGGTVTDRGVYWGTSPNPVSTGTKRAIGSNLGIFSATLTDLTPGTPYYVRAYATNSAGTSYGEEQQFTTYDGDTFTDSRDGNVYSTETIGTQTWMAENLRYLPSVSPASVGNDTEPYYYVYGYDGSMISEAKANVNFGIYGVLYNWPAVMNGATSSTSVPSGVQGICPSGWHLPSDAEWTILSDYLTNNGFGYGGSGSDIGKSMANTAGWQFSGTVGTIGNNQASNNSSGFTALAGGYRDRMGDFRDRDRGAYFWSSSQSDAWNAQERGLWYEFSGLDRHSDVYKLYGFSARCLRN